MKALVPENVHPPFGRYAHGVEIPAGWRVIRTSGQLGISRDGTIPDDAYAQACICFESIAEILAQGGMSAADVVHVSAFVTSRDYFPAYMRARDEFVGAREALPGSTLVIVSGFTREAFKVEVEVTAAAQ